MELLSPAKVNLSLHVTGKRDDGYHELSSIMCAVSLFDAVTLTPEKEGITLACSTPGVPEDETNLAWRAASLFFRSTGLPGGCRIVLNKNIPAGAGLGGGSGNAATVLKGLNQLHGYPMTEDEMVDISLELGADVPFFIRCIPALAQGVGELLEPVTLACAYPLLIIYPGTGLSTAEVYKNLNLGLTKREKKIKSPLLNEGVIDPLCHLHNDLELPARMLSYAVGDARKALEEIGADGVLMSGSGSAVFGLFADASKADAAYQALSTATKDHPGLPGSWGLYRAGLIV